MTVPGVPLFRRNLAIGAVCATGFVVTAELVVPAVAADGATGPVVRYALYLLAFSLWMAWFVLTGVGMLADLD